MSNYCSEHNSLKSNFKRKLSALAALLTFVSMSGLALSAYANVTTSTETDVLGKTGNMDVLTGQNNGHDLDVNLKGGRHGDVGQVDWQRFDVAPNQHVNFGFSGLSQTIINRVLGGKPSDIMGKLTNSCIERGCSSFDMTSKVILINPAGVMFGAGSTVDLNSFTISTFDFKDSKNLQELKQNPQLLQQYKENILDKFSPNPEVNGIGETHGDIVFSAKETERFEQAGTFSQEGGITKEQFDAGNSKISFDRTTLNVDKSFAAVADQISYKDSVLKTGGNYNYLTPDKPQSFSNARFITADGVTFRYLQNGYINDHLIAENTRDVARHLEINNSTRRTEDLNKNQADITTGSFIAVNNATNADSDIKIRDTYIRGTKLVSEADGSIYIKGTQNVDISGSRLASVNTSISDEINTNNQAGGNVTVVAGGNLTIDDSLIMSAGSSESLSGKVTLKGGERNEEGNVEITDTKVIAEGDVEITSANDIKIEGTEKGKSLIYADSPLSGDYSNIYINAEGKVIYLNKTDVAAAGDVNIEVSKDDNWSGGNIIVNGYWLEQDTGYKGYEMYNDGDEGNSSIIAKNGNVSMHAGSTSLNNVTLGYNELSFYDPYNSGWQHQNNVNLHNHVAFAKADGSKDVDIETNGTIMFMRNAQVKAADVSLDLVRGEDGAVMDDGTNHGINYTKTQTSDTAHNITAHTTDGFIFVREHSNLVASNDITFETDGSSKGISFMESASASAGNDLIVNSNKGTVTVSDSSNLSAENNTDIDANGNVTITGSFVSAGNDTTIDSQKDIVVNNGASITSEGNTQLNAQGNVTSNTAHIESTGDTTITAVKDIVINNSSTINSQGNTELNAQNDVKITISDITSGADTSIIAGHDIVVDDSNITSKGSSSFEATRDITFQKTSEISSDADTTLNAGNDILVDNSNITSKGSSSFEATRNITFRNESIISSDVDTTLNAGNDVTINGSLVNSKNDTDIVAQNNVTIDSAGLDSIGNTSTKANKIIKIVNSIIHAGKKAPADIPTSSSTITLQAQELIDLSDDTTVVATGDVDIKAVNEAGEFTGDIITNATANDSNGYSPNRESETGDVVIMSQNGNLTMYGKNTMLNNASLGYNDLKFYDDTQDNEMHTNHLEIAYNTTFTDYDNPSDINIKTNGSILLNNATMKTAELTIEFENPDEMLDKNLGFEQEITQNTADNINIESTRGNILSMSSKFDANKDINITTDFDGANVDIRTSDIYAGKNLTITSNGDVNVNSILPQMAETNSSLRAGKKLKISAKNKIDVKDESELVAKGNAELYAPIVYITDSMVEAGDNADEGTKNKVLIKARDLIQINDGSVVVSDNGNVELLAVDENGNLSGDVLINHTKKSSNSFSVYRENSKGNPSEKVVIAAEGGTLKMHGRHTHIYNGAFEYKGLSFFDKNSTKSWLMNDVSLVDDLVFNELSEDGEITGDINITTNGNLSSTNVDLKTTATPLSKVQDEDDELELQMAKNITMTTTRMTLSSHMDKLEAENNITMRSMGSDRLAHLSGSKLNAGNDVIIKADNGQVLIDDDINSKPTEIAAGRDIKVIQHHDIKFANTTNYKNNENIKKSAKFNAGRNIRFESTAGNIVGDKDSMATIEYGNRLGFVAKIKNIFSSKNSLKSTNVDYVAEEGNEFNVENDIQFENSTFKSKSNKVTTNNGDVILNNLKIISATGDGIEGETDALDKDTVTIIKANGRVTTKDITGTYTQDLAEDTHKAFGNVSVRNIDYDTENDTILDVGNTKLIVNTMVEAKDVNDENGSIELKVKNAYNKEAGLELTAENTEYDGQIASGRGPKIHLDSADNKLSISKLISDRLILKKKNKLYAASTTLTPEQAKGFTQDEIDNAKGYIEVKDKGAFNLDNSTGYPEGSGELSKRDEYVSAKGVTYKNHRDVIAGDITFEQDDSDENVQIQDFTDKAHIVEFDSQDDESDSFMLRYTKEYHSKSGCDPVPEIDDRNDYFDVDDGFHSVSLIEQQRLPRETKEVSKTSKIIDFTVDKSSNIMSAAAKIDIDENNQNNDEEKELN